MKPIRISYFSDILCIWAYIAQIRLEELKLAFPDQIEIEYYFVPIFGNVREKVEIGWWDRGGLIGYSNHVKEIASKFEHISVHPDIWTHDIPASSVSAHLFLCALQALEDRGSIAKSECLLEKTAWALREAFFTKLANVGDLSVQFLIARELGLPVDAIREAIDSGEAYAQLSKGAELVKTHYVSVSPTLIFNEGRQRLNGNVGYRVIEANIRELLHSPAGNHSWC
ncbi:DsbA family protein [Pseudanabaena sp. 'Roaring Creek']|uniref:DsbA family oxidoreductase n=1 Tax=Pseudanabaena sp. 'Roaring Creek' TaxID=1681830 RepID=UPI0006D7D71D|nr:DsbA family protein [Pseudanabaena sp. 'Roaring Creek']